MKLDKAIEILTEQWKSLDTPIGRDDSDALQLGIEALKRESLRRVLSTAQFPELLPGETKD